jgi:nucleoside-diphosphate-sugar epimerase
VREVDQISYDVLVVGGNSSLATPVIKLLAELKFSITATTRRVEQSEESSLVKNWLALDISSIESIENFIAVLGESRFNLILICIGSPSKTIINRSVYVETYLTNMIFLCQNLLTTLKVNTETALVHFSSRSSLYDKAAQRFSEPRKSPFSDLYITTLKVGLISL